MLVIKWKSLNSAVSSLIFSEQCWFRAEQRWFTLLLWNSAEQSWFLTDSEWNFLVNFSFFQTFENTSISWTLVWIFRPNCEMYTKYNVFTFLPGLRYKKNKNFWGVFWYCSSNKTDIVNMVKNISPFNWMDFWEFFKKFEFLGSFCRKMEKSTLFQLIGMPF